MFFFFCVCGDCKALKSSFLLVSALFFFLIEGSAYSQKTKAEKRKDAMKHDCAGERDNDLFDAVRSEATTLSQSGSGKDRGSSCFLFALFKGCRLQEKRQ